MEENKKPSNPSAFPTAQIDVCCSNGQMFAGMTLRDYFANSAMQTILDHKHYDGQQMYDLSESNGLSSYYMMGGEPPVIAIEEAKNNQKKQAEYVASLSYFMADAMLKQREL